MNANPIPGDPQYGLADLPTLIKLSGESITSARECLAQEQAEAAIRSIEQAIGFLRRVVTAWQIQQAGLGSQLPPGTRRQGRGPAALLSLLRSLPPDSPGITHQEAAAALAHRDASNVSRYATALAKAGLVEIWFPLAERKSRIRLAGSKTP